MNQIPSSYSKPKHAAGPIEPEAPRARKKWAGLHEALVQLKEAQRLARDGTLDDTEENAQ